MSVVCDCGCLWLDVVPVLVPRVTQVETVLATHQLHLLNTLHSLLVCSYAAGDLLVGIWW